MPSPTTTTAVLLLRMTAADDDEDKDDELPLHMTKELEDLQYQLSLIEALEERNRAQLDSFVDAQDQWDSLSSDEQELLTSKTALEARLEELMATLVNSWMGQRSRDG